MVCIQALAGDIVLRSWARHFTITVPLSTQVYKWVLVNLMLEVTHNGLASPPGENSRFIKLQSGMSLVYFGQRILDARVHIFRFRSPSWIWSQWRIGARRYFPREQALIWLWSDAPLRFYADFNFCSFPYHALTVIYNSTLVHPVEKSTNLRKKPWCTSRRSQQFYLWTDQCIYPVVITGFYKFIYW